jgi:hypothetical protein
MSPANIFNPPDIEGVEVRELRSDPPADPGLHTEGGKLYAGTRLVLKGWESFSGWYWFAVEKVEERKVADGSGSVLADGSVVDDVIWYGYVQGIEEEWGDFSEAEIRSLGNLAWPIKKCDLPYAGRRD